MATVKAKRVTVSGTVTPELHDFIESHRWANRMSKSDVVNEALAEWGTRHGHTVAAEAPEADAPEADAPEAAPEPKARARKA